MKKTIFQSVVSATLVAFAAAVGSPVVVRAAEESKAQAQGEVEVKNDVSRNPITGTTTETTVKRRKGKHAVKGHGRNHTATGEEVLKTERKVSKDGKTTSVTTEHTVNEDQK